MSSLIVKTFPNLYQLTKWISNEENINELKKKYPPIKYKAEMNLYDANIIVTLKKDGEGVSDPTKFFYS